MCSLGVFQYICGRRSFAPVFQSYSLIPVAYDHPSSHGPPLLFTVIFPNLPHLWLRAAGFSRPCGYHCCSLSLRLMSKWKAAQAQPRDAAACPSPTRSGSGITRRNQHVVPQISRSLALRRAVQFYEALCPLAMALQLAISITSNTACMSLMSANGNSCPTAACRSGTPPPNSASRSGSPRKT